MIRPIIFAPHHVLATPAKPVDALDRPTRQLIRDLEDTLIAADNPKGVGLAAVQIGIPKQIFVMRPSENDPVTTHINPVIVWRSAKTTIKRHDKPDDTLEGCLSVKNVWGTLPRHTRVRMRYLDERGKQQETEFAGFAARIVQHEVDHLAGILFTQRVLEHSGTLFRPTHNAEGKKVLEEFEI